MHCNRKTGFKQVSLTITDTYLVLPDCHSSRIAFMDYCPDCFFWTTRFLFLVFSFFVSVLCTRLGWPSRQLLSANKYTVSYHIVWAKNTLLVAEQWIGPPWEVVKRSDILQHDLVSLMYGTWVIFVYNNNNGTSNGDGVVVVDRTQSPAISGIWHNSTHHLQAWSCVPCPC